MNPQPKPVKWRSAGYKSYIKTKPCRKCGKPGPSDPAHESFGMKDIKGAGTKVSDSMLVPLCRECHNMRDHHITNAHTFWGNELLFVAIGCIKWRDEYLIAKGMK